jgi:hypothetical protein
MVYKITPKQVDEAYCVIRGNPFDKQVDEDYYHIIMKNAVNRLKSGLSTTAFRDFLEAKKLCDSEIFTIGYRDEAEKLAGILDKKGQLSTHNL